MDPNPPFHLIPDHAKAQSVISFRPPNAIFFLKKWIRSNQSENFTTWPYVPNSPLYHLNQQLSTTKELTFGKQYKNGDNLQNKIFQTHCQTWNQPYAREKKNCQNDYPQSKTLRYMFVFSFNTSKKLFVLQCLLTHLS